MRILFLDVDGVLNSAKSSFNTDGWPIDPYAALLVGRIVEATGCEIVVSSSWRHSEEGLAIIRKRVMPFIDITPEIEGASIRGGEIKAWLDEHPHVTKYAILDDDADMLPEQLPNFFRTTWEEGLTEQIANKVIKHLS